MATQALAREARGTPEAVPERPEPAARRLRVAKPDDQRGPVLRTVATTMLIATFVAFLALAALHTVLVDNQAPLDDLINENRLRRERIDQLQAEIAYLDSPEGLADQAHSAGLVAAAEMVTLSQIAAGLLSAPPIDPFSTAGLPARAEPADSAAPTRGGGAGE